jgi:hypothetical protein
MRHLGYCRLAFGHDAASYTTLFVGPDSIIIDRLGYREAYPLRPDKDNPTWREALIGDIDWPGDPPGHRELRFIVAGDVSTLTLRNDDWGLQDCRYVVDDVALSTAREHAPVVRFGGPLTFLTSLERRGSNVVLVAQVGAAGGGHGMFACISASLAQQISARPLATLHFPKRGGCRWPETLELGFDC